MGVGLIFCIGSVKHGDVRARIPSAGFFPFLGGITLISLSLVNLFSAIKNKECKKIEKFFPERDSWKKLLISLFALVAYSIGLLFLGFLLTNFLFMIFVLKLIEPQKWTITLVTSFIVSALSYVVFEVLLKVQLPYGVFGLVQTIKRILGL